MKPLFLVLAILGFIAPNVFVVMESMDSGNIMLYMDPLATFSAMFINNVSSAFVTDLLFVVLVFFIWTFIDAKSSGVRNIWLIWILTMLFGLAFTFPLYLYQRNS